MRAAFVLSWTWAVTFAFFFGPEWYISPPWLTYVTIGFYISLVVLTIAAFSISWILGGTFLIASLLAFMIYIVMGSIVY